MTKNNIQIWVALGSGAMILVLWAVHPGAGTEDEPKRMKRQHSSTETSVQSVSPVALAEPPLPGQPGSSPSLQDHTNVVAERRARQERALGTHDPREYLKSVPSGLGAMGREAAIWRTADHLAIEPESRPAFLAAARQAVTDMEQARALRSREVSALGIVSPSVGTELGRSSERYIAARERALARVDPYLGQSPFAWEFRHEFDAWAALVVSKGQGPAR